MSSEPTFDEVWDQALENYLTLTGRSPEDKAVLKKLHNPEDLYNKIEDDHRNFGNFRDNHSKLFNALSKAVRPFVFVSSIASSAVSLTPFAPASVVLGSVLFLVKSAGGVSEAYDWIEQLFDKLGGFAQRLEEYVRGGMNTHLRQKVIAILACLLEVLARSEQIIKDGRFKKYAAVLFLGRDEEVKTSFSKLARLFDDEQKLVQAITYATNQKIDKMTEEIDKTAKKTLKTAEHMDAKLDGLASCIQEVTSDRRAEQQKAILEEYLLTTAHAKNAALYEEYTETTLKTSGEWLLAEEKFQHWVSRKAPLLWVAGGPGTGKSYLSSITISKLKSTYPQDAAHPNRISVAYFYVKEHDQELQDLGNLLKSIAYQIVQVDAVFQSHAVSVLSKPYTTITPRKTWENLFLNFFTHIRDLPNAAMIVLDGLDEAPKMILKDLFVFLEGLADTSRCRPRLSFAFFGRPELAEYLSPKIQKCLSTIEIGERNEADIALYIKQHVTQVLVVKQTMQLKTKKAAATLARDIRDKIMAKADGMFFKVVLIMNQLYDKERIPSVFQAIEAAPPELEAMIAHVFERLTLNEDVDKDDLNELLLWVSFAKRPLCIAELYAVLKVRTGQAYDALDARLRGRFASLFKLSREISSGLSSTTNDEVFAADSDEFDIDDLSLDDDESGEGGQEDLNGTTRNEAVENESKKDGGLSKETLKQFRRTGVRLTHASIRDFLIKPRDINLDTHMGPVRIAMNPRTADMHIASVCMQRIIDYADKADDCDFLFYSGSYFTDHLVSIEATSITSEEKHPIILQICKLFFNAQGLENLITVTYWRFNKTIHAFFENPKFATTVRTEWLKYAVQDHLSTEEWDWVRESINSSKEFFRPLALQASKMWLTKNGHNDPAYCEDRFQLYLVWIIHCHLEFDDANDQEVRFLDIGGLTAGEPPAHNATSLQKLVEFSDVEYTQHWYTSYGWILVLGNQHDAAIAQFNHALDIDKGSWKALQGLSKCLVEQEKYDEATARLKEALRVVPESLKEAASTLRSDLISVVLSKKDFNAAFDYAKDTYTAKPTNSSAISPYIQSLYALRDYQGILKVIQDLQQRNSSDEDNATEVWADFNFLSLRDVHSEIGYALRFTGSGVIVQSWIYACLSEPDLMVDFTKAPWLAAWLAEYMYSFYDEVDESMQLFERIKSPKFRENLGPELLWAYDYPSSSADVYLTAVYYQKAAAASKARQDPGEWISKLRNLAVAEDSESKGTPVYKMNDSALALGVYLRRYGGADKSTWKSCLRNYVIQAIDMLGDDDPFNDIHAYAQLVKVLLAAGDVRNASAAAAVVLMPEAAVSDPSLLKALEAIKFTSGYYGCDGLCTTQFHIYKEGYKELHFCEECLDTCFCEECFPIVKQGELLCRVCSPDHPFLRVFPVSEDAKDIAARFIDRKTMEVQKEWLDALRKEWC